MPGAIRGPRTLYDKVFEDHIVDEKKDETVLLYIGAQEEQRIVQENLLTFFSR